MVFGLALHVILLATALAEPEAVFQDVQVKSDVNLTPVISTTAKTVYAENIQRVGYGYPDDPWQDSRCPYAGILFQLLSMLMEFLQHSTESDKVNKVIAVMKNYLHNIPLGNHKDELYMKLKRLEDQLHSNSQLHDYFTQTGKKPNGKSKTTIVFKTEVPNLGQPKCKSEFSRLIQTAYNTYISISSYPNCDPNYPNYNEPPFPFSKKNVPFDISFSHTPYDHIPSHNVPSYILPFNIPPSDVLLPVLNPPTAKPTALNPILPQINSNPYNPFATNKLDILQHINNDSPQSPSQIYPLTPNELLSILNSPNANPPVTNPSLPENPLDLLNTGTTKPIDLLPLLNNPKYADLIQHILQQHPDVTKHYQQHPELFNSPLVSNQWPTDLNPYPGSPNFNTPIVSPLNHEDLHLTPDDVLNPTNPPTFDEILQSLQPPFNSLPYNFTLPYYYDINNPTKINEIPIPKPKEYNVMDLLLPTTTPKSTSNDVDYSVLLSQLGLLNSPANNIGTASVGQNNLIGILPNNKAIYPQQPNLANVDQNNVIGISPNNNGNNPQSNLPNISQSNVLIAQNNNGINPQPPGLQNVDQNNLIGVLPNNNGIYSQQPNLVNSGQDNSLLGPNNKSIYPQQSDLTNVDPNNLIGFPTNNGIYPQQPDIPDFGQNTIGFVPNINGVYPLQPDQYSPDTILDKKRIPIQYDRLTVNHDRIPYILEYIASLKNPGNNKANLLNNYDKHEGDNIYSPDLPGFGATNPTKLANKAGIIELTYVLKRPQPLYYQPVYYVKYRLPYAKFIQNYRNLIRQKPVLRSEPEEIYKELISLSNITEVSPDLKGYEKDEIINLMVHDGTLVKAKLINGRDDALNEQLEIVQDLNSNSSLADISRLTNDTISNADTLYENKIDNFDTDPSLIPDTASNEFQSNDYPYVISNNNQNFKPLVVPTAYNNPVAPQINNELLTRLKNNPQLLNSLLNPYANAQVTVSPVVNQNFGVNNHFVPLSNNIKPSSVPPSARRYIPGFPGYGK